MASVEVRRAAFTLPGGLTPDTHKERSTERPCRAIEWPDQLLFPVHFSGGGAGEVLVQVGERVFAGTPIIRTASGILHHSSASGLIHAIEDHPICHPAGNPSPCVVVTPDRGGCHTTMPALSEITAESLSDRAAQAGIIGLGGAGFPSHQKWTEPLSVLLINGAECEPYLTADDMLMRISADHLIRGATALAQALDIPRVVLGIEDNKPEALEAIIQAAKSNPSDVHLECVVLETRYPSGGERQLTWLTLGIEVQSQHRPTDHGVLVHNPGTLVALSNAILGQPLTDRIVTVTGEALSEPRNWRVPIGTPVNHLLQACGFNFEPGHQVTLGGPMMGHPLNTVVGGITKTTNCLLVRRPKAAPQSPCIRCGECATACPVRLQPQLLWQALEGDQLQRALYEGLEDCILCGACNAVCPSAIPLAERFRVGRYEATQKARIEARAEVARIHFEARKVRLEQRAMTQQQQRAKRQRSGAELLEKARRMKDHSA